MSRNAYKKLRRVSQLRYSEGMCWLNLVDFPRCLWAAQVFRTLDKTFCQLHHCRKMYTMPWVFSPYVKSNGHLMWISCSVA
jgi:hypothetical protein